MGSPSEHPGQSFCSTCPNGGAWKETHQFYVRRPGRPPVRKDHCADCRQAQWLSHLIAASADYFGVAPAAISLPTRGVQQVAHARQSVMYLLHARWGWSTYRIAAALYRDRRTVSHGVGCAQEFLTEQCVKTILATLKSHTPS